MRIIAGSARGRLLKTPSSNRIRPTADRIKEALFSILTSRCGNFSGLRVLDICAGTGNLGIEALSRGAAQAVFIDDDPEAVTLIKANLTALGFSECATVLGMSAKRGLERLSAVSDRPFDVVFFDPPYVADLPTTVLPQLGAQGMLAATAIVVVEQQRHSSLADAYGTLVKLDHREYGDTALFFYTPAPPLTSSSEH
jgi:16S rRNA (guanine(966)-N(2))-methyltransferase RsmD